MTYDEFRESLAFDAPPADLTPTLAALWHMEKDDWHAAHEIVQAIESKEAAWVHAHLHRVEGDLWNADYWYRRAGKTRPEVSLEGERAAMIKSLLGG